MSQLSAHDYLASLHLVQALTEAAADRDSFARAGVALLPQLVASEITTLSVCDLASGKRAVVGAPGGAISAADRACFDHYFKEHPLVRHHGYGGGRATRRISDSVPFARFRNTGLYNEYYRSVGIDHVMALPVHVDGRLLVSFVLNRKRRDFSERDRSVLEAVRGALGALYRQAALIERLQKSVRSLRELIETRSDQPAPNRADRRLTPRENDVLHWLAAGKTDRDIGVILGISRRTVHKHLQRIYDKLGVETRTAAVLRAIAAPP